jgi:hypothetical protein
MHRNSVVVGFALRMSDRLKLHANFDDEGGDATFFRTDRRNFRRVRTRGRYQVRDDFQVGISASIWNNDNSVADLDFLERSREETVDISFTPQSGKWISLIASYGRGTFRSDLPFIIPQSFQVDRSIYRERGHSSSVSLTVKPFNGGEAQVTGDFFVSTGDRPTRFYNPRARLSFGVGENSSLFGEWRWHEYSNQSFSREAFRAHLLATGVQYRF